MKQEILDLLDLNTPGKYTLSIRLDSDGFCFSLYDHSAGCKLITVPFVTDPVTSMLANIKGMMDDMSPLLECKFRRVNVVMCSERVTYVPTELFDADDAETMFDCCFRRESCEQILYNTVSGAGCVVLFGINEYVKRYFDMTFGDVKYLSSSSCIISRCSDISRDSEGINMFACIFDERVGIYTFEGPELKFANVFVCNNNYDRLYYIMNVWKSMNMSQLDDGLFITSDSELSDMKEMEKNLGLYVNNIFKVSRGESFRQISVADSVPACFDIESLMLENI